MHHTTALKYLVRYACLRSPNHNKQPADLGRSRYRKAYEQGWKISSSEGYSTTAQPRYDELLYNRHFRLLLKILGTRSYFDRTRIPYNIIEELWRDLTKESIIYPVRYSLYQPKKSLLLRPHPLNCRVTSSRDAASSSTCTINWPLLSGRAPLKGRVNVPADTSCAEFKKIRV
jgi:hypothetical protein